MASNPPVRLYHQIDHLNSQAWRLRHTEAERAMQICRQAYELATTGELADEPYQQGMAASLVTQAFFNQHQGKLDVALAQNFEATQLLEGAPPDSTLIEAWRAISWIYYFMGDHSTALDYCLRALKCANELGNDASKAAALDTLSAIYSTSKDWIQAQASHQEAVRIVRKIGDRPQEAIYLNNMAMNLLDMGDLKAALEASQTSIELANQLSLVELQVYFLDTLGRILEKKGELSQAEVHLKKGLAMASRKNLDLGQVYCLLALGKIELQRNELDQAEAHLQQGLQIAQRIGGHQFPAECHELLAKTYEQQGNLVKALDHYKAYFYTNEQIHNDASEKRMAALKVAHQLETAQRDAEIYRLHNVELRREIDERIRAEKELERLATIDSLTGLFNRRCFFERSQKEFERAVRYGRPLCAFIIDIDHFKTVNDSYGHRAGDQVLTLFSSNLRSNLREIDLIGRYGGEEFCVIMPETSIEQGRATAERIRAYIEQEHFQIGADLVSVTVSIGVAAYLEGEERAPESLDQLLDQADQALYQAKRTGRNQVRMA